MIAFPSWAAPPRSRAKRGLGRPAPTLPAGFTAARAGARPGTRGGQSGRTGFQSLTSPYWAGLGPTSEF